MSTASSMAMALTLVLALAGCGDGATETRERSVPTPADVQAASEADATANGSGAGPAASAQATGARAGAGIVALQFQGEGIALQGDYPATLCGGSYLLGKGVSYQVRADGWQLTIGLENERPTGSVPLVRDNGDNRVFATVNGPVGQFVRKPSAGGTLELSEDHRQAVADLELVDVVGTRKLQVRASFDCD